MAIPMQYTIGDEFDNIVAAKKAITRFLTDNSESYLVSHSNSKRFVLKCKSGKECDFHVCVTTSTAKSKGCKTTIRSFKEHTCSPTTHYKFKGANSKEYLLDHHRGSVAHNRAITVAQIIANEKEKWRNDIKYKTAWCVREALILEMDGKEEDDFKKMNSLKARIDEMIERC